MFQNNKGKSPLPPFIKGGKNASLPCKGGGMNMPEGLRKFTLTRIAKFTKFIKQFNPLTKREGKGSCHPELVSGTQYKKFSFHFPHNKEGARMLQPINNPVRPLTLALSRRARENQSAITNRKAAFTLAEVLITLGIIGLVAAMTLPSLVNKYREQEIITRVKKTYTSIAQALELVQANYGTPGDNSSLFAKGRSSAEITKELSKYFNGARYCEAGANAKGCKNLNYKIKYASLLQSGATGAQMTNMTGYPRIVLNNGVVLAIGTKNSDCADYVVSGNSYNSDGSIKKNPDGTTATWTQTRNNCGIVVFDVNGSRRPNQFGYDAYQINVFKNKIGKDYWGAMGTSSLDNILSGKKNPLVYTDYDENGEFEW